VTFSHKLKGSFFMPELLTTGQAARLLNRQVHQVRRVLDENFPETQRAGQNRLIRPDQLPELATAIAKRYRTEQVSR